MWLARATRKIPFVHRLAPSLLRRAFGLVSGDGYVGRRREGLLLLLNVGNFVDRQLLIYDRWEGAQLDRLAALVAETKATRFFDVGANFGLYALALARRFPMLYVTAYEPDRRNASHLRANLYLNRMMGRIRVEEFGLSDSDGTAPFLEAGDHSTGRSGIVEAGGSRIAVRRLDGLVHFEGERLAFKIDVEGHELKVLQGMRQSLEHNLCVVQVECFGANQEAVRDLMTSLDYRLMDRIGPDHFYVKLGN